MSTNRFGKAFSVIVPAYNAEGIIDKCLKALLNQTIPVSDYEIIVVDDGSSDGTSDIVKAFEVVRLIRQENQGPASARNNGAKHASGSIVLFTDADCVANRDWIEQMILPFQVEPEIVGVKGAYKTNQVKLAPRFVQMEYEDKYELMKRDKYIDFIDTYSAAFNREIFLRFGGYDRSFPVACAEDIELTYRMSAEGLKMVFNPNAVVYHTHPPSFSAYFKKKYKFAYWRMLALRKNPSKAVKDSHTPQVMKIQLLFAPTLLMSALLMPSWSGAVVFCAISVGVFLLTTLPFVWLGIKKDKWVAILAPGILAGRSVSQFLGVLSGSVMAMKITHKQE